jgi:hypothetical protein
VTLHFKPRRIDAPIFRLGGVCDHAVCNMINLFPGAALLPIPIGATRQEIVAQPIPLLIEAMSQEHRQRLAVCSVALVLGTGGLTAIFFDVRDRLLDFLRRNPVLGGTLITCHGETFIVWIKTGVPHPRPLSTSAFFSVVTDGKILVYDRAVTARPGYFLTTAPPMRVDLEILDWGPDPDGRIAAWLVGMRCGDYFRRNQRGTLRANVEAWTAFLAKRLQPDLQYRRSDRSFLSRSPDSGTWLVVGDSAVVNRMMETVRTAPIGPETGKAIIDDRCVISTLLPKLRAALQADPVAADPFVGLFLCEAVVPSKGSNFTLKEFYAAYDQLRQIRGWPPFSDWDLGKATRRLLAGPPYLKRVSKSIPRNNGNNDGYRGFAIHLPATLSTPEEASVAAA